MIFKKLGIIFLVFYILLLLFEVLLELMIFYKSGVFKWSKQNFLSPLSTAIGVTFVQIILHRMYPNRK
ncbi:hypothetical protein CVP05_11460 [Conservatibacter flavescens]|uniref:Uncharacterized protein n=1 Tax=Conservatibacter flavescens TaxID=28161 RepID=A0A2M8RZT8_9PAST|nr:hypothetical protein CVP05_11460 [Conservatibacter flavescens]